MKTVNEIREKIELIRDSDFKIEMITIGNRKYKSCKLLRIAQSCKDAVFGLEDVPKEEVNQLHNELDEVMKEKFRVLNPDFSEETLENMLCSYVRGWIKYPLDILVLDDAVFHKEGEYDDFDTIYKVDTSMFKGERPYFNIKDEEFIIGAYLENYGGFTIEEEDSLTKEDDIFTSKFISDNINSIYHENITRPIYEFIEEGHNCGYSGISVEAYKIDIYFNMYFGDIGKSLKNKEECDIKLCIQKGEEFTLYYIHQSFKEGNPVWEVVDTNSNVWRLTEAAMEYENSDTNRYKK